MTLPIFPTFPGLAWPVTRTPQWKTLVQEAVSGAETRAALWIYERYSWEVSLSVLRAQAAFAELQTLIGFYNSVQGSFGTWLYTDPNDNQVTAQQIGTGDGTTTGFQLIRTLGGNITPVLAPHIVSTVTINGTATSAYTVNATNGVLTFTSAPASGAVILASFTYYWLCRFSEDTLGLSNFAADMWSAKSLKFQSVKA